MSAGEKLFAAFRSLKTGRFLISILLDQRYTFLFFFGVAFFARVVTWINIPVDWNGDSFVHWQISYLTLKIGFRHFRMWDLNGLEYFWGMVPHLVEAGIMGVLGASSLLPYRIFNMILGSINAYLVYLIGRDNIYWEVGLYSALFVAFFPVFTVFDITALQDTLALFFLLLGLYYYSSKPFNAGILFALASQSRIEYWLVTMIFIFSVPLFERKERRRFTSVMIGWVFSMVPFLWIFLTHTGNPIYPLYYSLGNVLGGGVPGATPKNFLAGITRFLLARLTRAVSDPLYLIALLSIIGTLGVLAYLYVRPKRRYYLYTFFIATMLVNGLYTISYIGTRWLWMMSRILMPTLALGALLIFYLIYKTPLRRARIQLLLIIVIAISGVQIYPKFQIYQKWTLEAYDVADTAMKDYTGGTVICDYQTINYRIINKWQIPAKNILSNQYSPLYYGIKDPDEFVKWFRKFNVTVWIDADWAQAKAVLSFCKRYLPQLLIFRETLYSKDIYEVNTTFLKTYNITS